VFAQAISQEMGCAISVARGAQVPVAAEHLRVARDLAAAIRFRHGIAAARPSCASRSACAA
jgi:aldehyde dehydrogenase (NAD+)